MCPVHQSKAEKESVELRAAMHALQLERDEALQRAADAKDNLRDIQQSRQEESNTSAL